MSKRSVFSREFKMEAVKLVTEQGYGVGQAAESLGISANSLRKWREMIASKSISIRTYGICGAKGFRKMSGRSSAGLEVVNTSGGFASGGWR
jgi:hypothetical protein